MVVRTLPTLAVAATALLLTGCAGAPTAGDGGDGADAGFPIELTSCGFTSEIADRPENAITMNQGATEVALALGVEDQLAGTAYLDDEIPEKWRDAYESVPVVADAYPDSETVLAERPDLIYASYASAFDAESAGDREELADSAIATYVSPLGCPGDDKPEVSWDSVWGEIDDVAAAFGVPDRAEEIRVDQQETLDELEAEGAGEGLRVFWFDSGTDTAFAGAGQGGPQLILDAIGAENVFGDQDGGWADVSWEQVVAEDPDVIVLADAGWSTAEDKIEFLRNDPALSQLRAVQQERFVTVPFSASTPGVRLVDGASSVAEQLTAQ
ncbi:iron ABC transporter substrate-binding protein [Aeromicrobium sp. PE09-221]|uniref:ABC transporter substrate-binding protein n=1 Tax=Aeromicrobium sp. PE09-221 TaxID=1898043 RepID=UPI000B3E7D47|nr:ABC transporter substrate-binding protein [Aeromicrobium sp. PE09-221]OUZ07557.1 iron ABC transporter substrate-binding protein [Aeromicrobium sp. PE09-221]